MKVRCECQVCQKEYFRTPSQVGPYCSSRCFGAVLASNVETRFWRNVEKSDGCWLWTGYSGKDGYGYLRVGTKQTGAHRYSYELHNGPIPEGLWVLHRCDNPPCVRPDHLWAGLANENTADRDSKQRQALGERNRHAKLNAEDVLEIRRRLRQGSTNVALAEEYGVAKSEISHIRTRRVWKHLP